MTDTIKQHIDIDFAITSYCQARCRTCPRTNSDTGEQADYLVLKHQDYDAFERNTTNSKYFDTNLINTIIFCGQTGDPMMHPQITKFVDQGFKIGERVLINTNGGLRSPSWYTEMGEKYGSNLVIKFGIDGIDHETNWKYREGVNFKKAYDNMTAFAKTPGDARWDFLIFEWNYHQIPEVAKLAKELNVEVLYKINNQFHGLIDPAKLPMVKEMICQANTI